MTHKSRHVIVCAGTMDGADRREDAVTQLRLLTWVAEEEGLSNADLADRLYVTRPSVSALLDRLERGGFIRREITTIFGA